METGSVAIAHRKHPDGPPADEEYGSTGATKMSSSFVAGNYGIGDMTVFLGYSQDSMKDTGCDDTTRDYDDGCVVKSKTKTTYAGVHGGVGDTGVNYVFTMRNEKMNADGFVDTSDNDPNTPADSTTDSSKKNPWTLGLSRGLGGGATVNFEHGEPDSDDGSSTAIWLQVDF